MHLFLFDWFGWSLLWILPLGGRLLISLLTGRGLRGRGSIRLWLGTLLLLCGSSVIEALLRSQGDAVLSNDLFGQALARNLSNIFGKLLSVLAMLATAVLGGFWLFGRSPGRNAPSEEESDLPAHASVPRRTQVNLPPSIKNLPAVAGKTATSTDYPGQQPVRKRDPWPLPNELQASSTSTTRPSGGKWPVPGKPPQESAKRPARPASEWAVFESLRPTEAMLARANAQQASQPAPPAPATVTPKPALASSVLSKPRPAPGITADSPTKVRISTASNRSDAIPTALSNALATHQPSAPVATAAPATVPAASVMAAPLPPAIAPPSASPIVAPAGLPPLLSHDLSAASQVESDTATAVTIAPAPPAQTFNIIETQAIPAAAPATPPAPTAVETAAPPMQIRSWNPPPAATVTASTAPSLQRPSDIPLPGLDLLDQGSDAPVEMDAAQLLEIGQLIEQRLKEFKVPVTVLGAYAGPVITRFEIEPALGVRGAQIVNLMKDLARALGLTSIRVVETIPGKTCMGLELPNPKRQMIRLAEIIRADAYTASASHLTLAMGKDITGIPVATDLARAPHMLVAGTTGSGKSVAINAMILSLLYKATPDDVRLIMIDPKT